MRSCREKMKKRERRLLKQSDVSNMIVVGLNRIHHRVAVLNCERMD